MPTEHDSGDRWIPSTWPLFWRRAFLLTLPVSGPIWFVAVLIGMICIGLIAILIGGPMLAYSSLKETLWDDEKADQEPTNV